MRPLRLQLEGFTCFKDPQDPLELASLDLFAISGPTGAGKSSLLDAMIFALFGRVPRMGKVGLAELISLGRDRMVVRLDFRLGEATYRVVRTAHRSRSSQAMLDELRGELERPVAEGVKNVDEEVQRLLGFDYDTFTRAVILPQGDFAAFLKGRRGEQQKILRDLLRLHIYEGMRRLAGEEQRRLKTRIESDERRIVEDFADATPEVLDERRTEAEALIGKLAGTGEALRELRERLEQRRRELDRVRGLLEPRDKARRRARELTDRRDRDAAKLGELRAGREELVRRYEELVRELDAARAAAEAIGYDAELDARLDKVRDAALELAGRRRALHREAAQAEELADGLREVRGRLAEREASEAEAQRRLRTAEAERRESEAAQREAEHRNHVVLLQRELAPGEPCPVCEQQVGELPEVPKLPELDAAAEAVAEARRAEESARHELESARKAAAEARAETDAQSRQADEADRRAKQLAVEVGAEAGALQAEIGEAVRDDPGEHVEERVQARVRQVAEARAAHAAAEAERRRLEKLSVEVESFRERLDGEVGSLEKRQQELEREIASALEEADDYDSRIREVTSAGESLEDLQKELEALQARESEERRQLGVLEGSLDDLRRRIVRRGELEEKLAARRASHGTYSQLAQDLRSDRFEAYLLEKTFRELVAGASVRLMNLSQRYTFDFADGGFRVLDHDNAGQPRSADTLSGGETFLASVSLALELSEQIQREAGAVSLDSIFIDEGFGTLDPETLEIVTEAIESLPTGGRMVGIITHIPELTRRLPFRVWVDKLPAGSRYRVEEG